MVQNIIFNYERELNDLQSTYVEVKTIIRFIFSQWYVSGLGIQKILIPLRSFRTLLNNSVILNYIGAVTSFINIDEHLMDSRMCRYRKQFLNTGRSY